MGQQVQVMEGVAGPTYQVAGTDSAVAVTAIKLNDANSRRIRGLLIEPDVTTGYAIRIAFGGTDPTTILGHHVSPGQAFPVNGYKNCSSLKWINATGGENALINFTPYY